MTALLAIHPIADILPMISEDEYTKLCADILRNGLNVPITTYQNMILDGRARYRACLGHRVEPRFVEWDGEGTALEFVVRQNLTRRRLSDPQRAMAAARAMAGGGPGRPKAGAHPDTPSRQQLANLFGVTVSAVTTSRIILTRGTSEDVALIESGKVPRAELVQQIQHNIPPESRIKERRKNQDKGARNTMTRMGQVAYAMLAAAEEKRAVKSLRTRKTAPVIPTVIEIIKEVEVIREVPVVSNEADTLLAQINALLKSTYLSPNEAAVILCRDIPPYSLAALLDWLIEVQERMDRIIRKREKAA